MAERTGSRTNQHRRLWPITLAVVAAGMVAALGPLLLREPSFVERVSFVNRAPYDLRVEVSDDNQDRWMGVTTADAASTTLALEVIDQGPIWVFRFSAQGRDGDQLRISRADLQQAGWRIEIPDSVTDRLRQAGAPPTP